MTKKWLKIAPVALLISLPCLSPGRAHAASGCDPTATPADALKDMAVVKLAQSLAPALPGNLETQAGSIGLVQGPLAPYAPISQEANWSGIQGGPDFLVRAEGVPTSWQPRRPEAGFENSRGGLVPPPTLQPAFGQPAFGQVAWPEGAPQPQFQSWNPGPRPAPSRPLSRSEPSKSTVASSAPLVGFSSPEVAPAPRATRPDPAPRTQVELRDEDRGEPVARPAVTLATRPPSTAPLSGGGRKALIEEIHAKNPAIPLAALEQALAFTDLHRDRVRNDSRLLVVDMDKPSSERRLFLIDMRTRDSTSYLTTHGVGSGAGALPSDFDNANRIGSNKTALGGYVTREIFDSRHTGISLKLEGLDPTNNLSLDRGTWIHDAQGPHGVYVREDLAGKAPTGLSEGCLAVDPKVLHDIIDPLQGGSVVYIYSSKGTAGRTLASLHSI